MGETLTPKATIVVPVYNSSRSIQRCLDSLLVQSERSIQVVCVNDGSTDDSLNVLRQIAQADDRVLVIDQENAGVSCARNTGIDAAEGETVFFVDADDYIDAQTVERVLHAMESSDAEVVVFGGVCEPADAAPKRVQQLMSPKAGTFGAVIPNYCSIRMRSPMPAVRLFRASCSIAKAFASPPVWLWARTSSSNLWLMRLPVRPSSCRTSSTTT